jgi:dTDP-4-amino-4,6-dideoxygalactose transaminase
MGNAFDVVRQFERELCNYTGAPYAVTTTSCTAALLLAVAWRLRNQPMTDEGPEVIEYRPTPVEIPKRTYIGVPYAIRAAGGRPTFRDEDWKGAYELKPLQVWDSARWFTEGLYCNLSSAGLREPMVCCSFHWQKTLGIQQGGCVLHDDPEADAWLRRARFDGRAEGVPPSKDNFTLPMAWHAYMSPETAAAGLVRLAHLPEHNEPLPNDDYPDLSKMGIFR